MTTLFTKENAAEFAKRSHAPTSARYAAKIELPTDPVPADKETADADEFRRLRLARVRKQLDKIDGMLAKESDPGKIDRLASAAIRLNEQERQLSNRSLPPTLKASQVKSKRQPSGGVEPEAE